MKSSIEANLSHFAGSTFWRENSVTRGRMFSANCFADSSPRDTPMMNVGSESPPSSMML